ncbi:undecaprenyl-diphosphate phosphatase [bacterium]|nr:undecaprenyl-diphosphate phosphatase [bacterium]
MVISSVILALLQAVAEFLPISSSGHLVLAQNVLNLSPKVFNLSFDIILHFGSLLALLIFFRKDIMNIVKGSIRRDKNELRLLKNIVLATIPAIVIGYFFGDYIENNFRGAWFVVFNLVFFGIIFMLVENYSKMTKGIKSLSLKESLIIGCAQVIAFIPGVSRSGITIITGVYLGLKREDSARFAFLVAIPAISLATVKGIKDIITSKEGFTSIDLYILGFLISFVASFMTIKYFLQYVKNHSFKPFIYYRFILAFVMFLYLAF